MACDAVKGAARDPGQEVKAWEKAGYGLGNLGTNLVWRSMIVFLPIFYTDVFGLSAAAVGTLLLVCRYVDGVSDVGMGILADRTKTRWGRYRPWVLWTALPLAILITLTFTVPNFSHAGKLLYAYATYTGLAVVFTANDIPYSSMTGVISADPIQRTSISSWRFIFAFLGALITQGFGLALVSFFGHGNDARGYRSTMIFFGCVCAALLLVTFLTTRERVPPPVRRSSVARDLADLLRNGPWRTAFGVGVMFLTLATTKAGATLYYFKYYVKDLGLAPAFMVTTLFGAMAGAAATKPLAARFGKGPSMIGALAATAVFCALLYLPGPSNHVAIFVLGTLAEASTGPVVALLFVLLADAADYSEWKNRRSATALVFSAGTLAMKTGAGVGGAVTGWVLMTAGYVANAAQAPSALQGIRLLMTLIPAGAAVVAIAIMAFYPLDRDQLDRIQKELGVRRELG